MSGTEGLLRCEQEREYGLAKILAQRLHQYVAGDEEGFVTSTGELAQRLARLPFGVPLLHRIGYGPRHRLRTLLTLAVWHVLSGHDCSVMTA